MFCVVMTVVAWVVFLGGVFAGEGYKSILSRWMKRGHMTEAEIKHAQSLPEEIVFNDTLHAFIPGTIFKFDLNERAGYTYTLEDTIFGVKIFPKEEGKAK